MVTQSYPQGIPTRQNFFLSCMDIRMDIAYSSTHRGNGPQRKGKKNERNNKEQEGRRCHRDTLSHRR
jgi:hypothetical protein